MNLLLILWTCNLCVIVKAKSYNLFGDAGQAYSIEVLLGKPPQKMNLIVDTGSTTLAIAAYSRNENDKYFHSDNSSTLVDSGNKVQAKYSQGMWVGNHVIDYISFPSMPYMPTVKSDFALITKSHKFFMNGSGWQGLLGMAFSPVGAWGENDVVGSWLDPLECSLGHGVSFGLELCGPQSETNATHYGNLFINVENKSHSKLKYRTPVLHKRWYEVGVLGIKVLQYSELFSNTTNNSKVDVPSAQYDMPDTEMCQKLNEEKSIVDSGTTNLRLPDNVFKKVVDSIGKLAQANNILILDEFWYNAEAACWPEPRQWSSLPWIAIDLLDMDPYAYFTIIVPPQNYMRVISAQNNSGGVMSQYCYKLGLEAGGKDTVLGYTVMEGLQVLFNRSGGWIEWDTSDCGPNAFITGPYLTGKSFISACDLKKPETEVAPSIKAAQWTLLAISLIAGVVLIYLLLPCIKTLIFKPILNRSRTSISRNALFEQEFS